MQTRREKALCAARIARSRVCSDVFFIVYFSFFRYGRIAPAEKKETICFRAYGSTTIQ